MKSTNLYKTAFLMLFAASISISSAQTISAGTKMGIMAGTTMTSSNNMKITSGGVLDNQGTLVLKQNLVNENTTPNSIGNGTLELSGTTAQSVSGQNIIQNLVVNNSSGISLGGNTRVNGTFTLTNGVVSLGNNNLTLGPAATVSGTPSASKMVAADGSGQLRKEFASAGSFTYPVGDVTSTPEYSPVTLNFTAGTFGSDNFAGVNLTDAQYPSGDISGDYLTRYWNLAQNNITDFECNATFKYVVSDVTNNESGISCVKVEPLPWEGYSAANTSTHELTADGITSFSTFTGAGIINSTLKVFLEGLYAADAHEMRKAQDADIDANVWDKWKGTIADTISVLLAQCPSDPGTYSWEAHGLSINTDGTIKVTMPASKAGDYYIVIKHRSSVETWSASPYSFTGTGPFGYDFDDPAKAWGDNLIEVEPGVWAIYCGDVSSTTDYVQDGYVDLSDVQLVNNANTLFLYGYLVEDVNGDGFVDLSDVQIVNNNNIRYAGVMYPCW